jgi:hypothetical protein
MLRTRITLPHFSVSSAMNFPNAADVIDIGSTPKPANRAKEVTALQARQQYLTTLATERCRPGAASPQGPRAYAPTR